MRRLRRRNWRIYLAAFRCAASEASRFLAASARRSAPSRAMVRSAERRSFRLCFDDACFDDGCFAAVMTRPFLSSYGRAQARCSGASFLLMATLKRDEYFLPEPSQLVPLANSTSMKPGQVLSSRDKLTTNAWRQDGTSFPHTKKVRKLVPSHVPAVKEAIGIAPRLSGAPRFPFYRSWP